VLRRPRVALFSTGDELVMPGEPLPPGAIYNSNRFTLRALLQAAGLRGAGSGHRARPAATPPRRAARGRARHDLILTSGGVSVGEEDHIKPAVQAEGRLELWQMAIKPGKPLAFGAVRRRRRPEALFIGLPGNPVSSFVTFLLLPWRRCCARCRAPTRRRAACRCAPTSTGPSPTGGASSCACGSMPRRPGPVRQPELGRADFGRVGRRPGRQPGRPGHSRSGDTVRFLPLSELVWR
jgi:molybdenum cofactor synthesis domain-containing protein